MSDRARHLAQARGNREHALWLLDQTGGVAESRLQWAVTAAFYSCVHFIEAELSDSERHSDNHYDRQRHMDAVGIHGDIQDAYKNLKDYSEDVRYDLADYPEEFVRETVCGRYLDRVARWAHRP